MRNNFKTDALARILALDDFKFKPAAPEKALTARQQQKLEASETDRLNALPRDQQTLTFCNAMGYRVIEYPLRTF